MVSRKGSWWLAAALLFICGQSWAAEERLLHADAELIWGVDDNLTAAQRDRDIVDDEFQEITAGVALPLEIHPRYLLTLRAFGSGRFFEQVKSLDSNSLGGEAALRWQNSSRFTSPIAEINVKGYQENSDTRERDSYVTEAQFFISKRFTDRITTTVGASYEKRLSEGNVWDLESSRAFANLDWRLLSRLSAYVTYSEGQGDSFSSGQIQFCNGGQAPDILDLVNASTALEPDRAMEKEFCGRWVAYRLDATTQVVNGGFNFALSNNLALDLSLTDVQVRGDLDNDYDRQIIRGTVLARF